MRTVMQFSNTQIELCTSFSHKAQGSGKFKGSEIRINYNTRLEWKLTRTWGSLCAPYSEQALKCTTAKTIDTKCNNYILLPVKKQQRIMTVGKVHQNLKESLDRRCNDVFYLNRSWRLQNVIIPFHCNKLLLSTE